MNERVNRYLELLKKDIEKKQDVLNQVERNPLLFLSDLVRDREGLIPMVLGEQGLAEQLAYQNWLYPRLIRALVEKYNITDYTLHYNEELFPSPIALSKDDTMLAEIHPYEHTFIIKASEHLPTIMNQLLELIPEMMRLEEEIQLRQIEAENPLLLGGSNPIKLIRIGVNKKRAVESIKVQAVNQFEMLSECKQRYAQLEEELEAEEDAMFFEEDLIRIGKRLQEHYDFITLDDRAQALGSYATLKERAMTTFVAEREERLAPDED